LGLRRQNAKADLPKLRREGVAMNLEDEYVFHSPEECILGGTHEGNPCKKCNMLLEDQVILLTPREPLVKALNPQYEADLEHAPLWSPDFANICEVQFFSYSGYFEEQTPIQLRPPSYEQEDAKESRIVGLCFIGFALCIGALFGIFFTWGVLK
jgi:hypothetical protein